MNNGWIKTYRKMAEWEWYKDSFMVHLFIHLIITANHDDRKWKGVDIKRGQLVTSRKILSAQTGISERSIRTCLERLKSTNEITIQSTNRNSIITICNYDNYQMLEKDTSQQNDQPKRQQTTINRPTIKQELKEEEEIKENNIKEKYGLDNEFSMVVNDWFEYKKERKESYKSDKSKRSFISKLKNLSSNNADVARAIVEQSMANNWAGVFELKDKSLFNRLEIQKEPPKSKWQTV